MFKHVGAGEMMIQKDVADYTDESSTRAHTKLGLY